MKKILIVEDDEPIREGIRDFFVEHGFLVDTAEDGASAIAEVKKHQPDLAILDLGLPKMSGETVVREIKREYPNIPVIILTAKNHTSDIVDGFKLGADDYISKPFDLEELMMRVQARLKNGDTEKLKVDDLELDSEAVKVERDGKQIKLSPHEFKLLQYLMSNKGKVLSREMILSRVWQYSYDVDSRVVDVYMGYLRKKVDGNSDKKLLSSVRGFGYVIKD